MRTLGAGPNDLHDKIRVRMSVGVRVGSSVGMPVEAAVLGSGSGAVLAVAAVVFLVGAMMRLSRWWCPPVLSMKSCPTLHPLQGEYLASEAPLLEEYPDERAGPRI